MTTPGFWRDRAVLLTGHTGFKGGWLALWLHALGARVSGLSDRVPTDPSLFELACVGACVGDVRADVRDPAAVLATFARAEPEVVVHLAAQPIVRRSLADPRGTYETNVMGTVNVLEAARATPSVRVVVCVTSDKCYEHRSSQAARAFVESDPMGGHDPYSSSKGCAELVVAAYRDTYFGAADGARVASVRSGNVVGGGDWGEDRLIPDLVRAVAGGEQARVRNPDAVRPWQHVLNPLSGYLGLAESLHGSPEHQGGWNFGPDAGDGRSVRQVVERMSELWPGALRWQVDPGPHPPEAHYLTLDSAKARKLLGWSPTWDLDEGLAATVEWYRSAARGEDVRELTLRQIEAFTAAASYPMGSQGPP